MEHELITKRVGSLIKARPEFEERYIILHRHVFQGVLDRIRKSNIRNYSIFLLDGMSFSYYEYVGENYNTDMDAIADPETKDWWKLTDPMQEPLATRKEGEWWATMEQWLCLQKTISPSPGIRRIGLVAEVINGKANEVKNLFLNFPDSLEDILNKENFQKHNVFYKDGKIYLYYEYFGDDIWKSLSTLGENENFNLFQKELNKNLVIKAKEPWGSMKEVFHTD